jgi:hypothetical protein
MFFYANFLPYEVTYEIEWLGRAAENRKYHD